MATMGAGSAIDDLLRGILSRTDEGFWMMPGTDGTTTYFARSADPAYPPLGQAHASIDWEEARLLPVPDVFVIPRTKHLLLHRRDFEALARLLAGDGIKPVMAN